MKLIALDVGDRTVGVAGCDEMGLTTTGLYTIRRGNLDKDLEKILKTAEEREAQRIVIGLPFSMDGSEGDRAIKTRKFAEALSRKTTIPIVFQDERLSTFEAESLLRDSGMHWKKRKEVVDQVAAEIILRSYLEAGCPLSHTAEPENIPDPSKAGE